MIDLNEYRLEYREKETGKLFLVRRCSQHNFMIYDPVAKEKKPISANELTKNFKSEKSYNPKQESIRKCKDIFYFQ